MTLQHPLRAVESETSAVRAAPQRIPPIVHQTWAVNSFGRTHRASLRRFRALNADYGFRLWVETDIDAYMAANWSHHPVYDVFARAEFGPLKTDVWRYCVLYDLGGVYLDISKAVVVPLRELIRPETEVMISFDKRSIFSAEQGESLTDRVLVQDRAVSNWLMAVAPRHPLMLKVIDSIAHAYGSYQGIPFKNPKDAILDFTGPRRLTHALHEFLTENPEASIDQRDPDFGGTAIWEVAGAWVRYGTRPAYILASERIIVS